MQKKLDNWVISLCEYLPRDMTIYERRGFCMKPNEDCNHCRKNGDSYLCTKKTYTLHQELRFA